MSGSTMPELRVASMCAGDLPAVHDFLRRVPRGEYLFLKDDVDDPSVIEGWQQRLGAQVFIAFAGAEVAGLLAVVPGLGWSRHVGELRLVVDPAHREIGR